MNLIWSRKAQKDLNDVKNFYFKKIPNDLLLEIIDEIENAGQIIKKYPLIGKVLDISDKRKFVLNNSNYIILYRIIKDIVHVLRVLDTRMNNK